MYNMIYARPVVRPVVLLLFFVDIYVYMDTSDSVVRTRAFIHYKR